MKKQVLVLLAPGFEEIEAVTVVDILRRAGIHVVIAGTVDGPISAARGVKMLADISIDQVTASTFDMVVLPGGGEGTAHLGRDKRVQRILEEAIKGEKLVAAICAAPTLLTRFMAGKKATCYPLYGSDDAGGNSHRRSGLCRWAVYH